MKTSGWCGLCAAGFAMLWFVSLEHNADLNNKSNGSNGRRFVYRDTKVPNTTFHHPIRGFEKMMNDIQNDPKPVGDGTLFLYGLTAVGFGGAGIYFKVKGK